MAGKAARNHLDVLRQAAEGLCRSTARQSERRVTAPSQLCASDGRCSCSTTRPDLVPLGPSDAELAADLVRAEMLAPTDPDTESALRTFTRDVLEALEDARRGTGFSAVFAGRGRRAAAARGDAFLDQTIQWMERTGAVARLQAVDDRHVPRPAVPSKALTDPRGPVAAVAPDLSGGTALPLDGFGDLPSIVAQLADAIVPERSMHADVVDAGQMHRTAVSEAELDRMDVERLSDATGDRLRLGALRDADVTTVGAVLRDPVFPG